MPDAGNVARRGEPRAQMPGTLCRHAAAVFWLAVAGVSSSGAQQPAESGAKGCDRPPATSDSVTRMLYLHLNTYDVDALRPATELEPEDREHLSRILQRLRVLIPVPRTIGLQTDSRPPYMTAWRGPGDDQWKDLVIPSLEAHLRFTLHRDGRITRPVLTKKSISPDADRALIRGLHNADSTRLLADVFPRAGDGGTPSDSMRLELLLQPRVDTLLATTSYFEVLLPAYRSVPPRYREGNPAPRYPVEALRGGVGDSVIVNVVVNADGHLDMRTVRIAHATYRPTVAAVLEVLPHYRLEPGRIGECPVRTYVQMPFVFELR